MRVNYKRIKLKNYHLLSEINKTEAMLFCFIYYFKKNNIIDNYCICWCSSRSKSFTVLTGLNVLMGTSTKIVFQSLIAPFHKPGSSKAFSGLPLIDLDDINPVDLSTKFIRLYLSPFLSFIPHTKSTGLKCVDLSVSSSNLSSLI